MTNGRLSEIEMHNTLDAEVTYKPIGTEPHITFHVDWQQMKHPTPKMFHDVQDAQITLAILENHIQTESLEEPYNTAMDAVNALLREMVNARDVDGGVAKNLYMGNLEVLPEVEKEVEQVPVQE